MMHTLYGKGYGWQPTTRSVYQVLPVPRKFAICLFLEGERALVTFGISTKAFISHTTFRHGLISCWPHYTCLMVSVCGETLPILSILIPLLRRHDDRHQHLHLQQTMYNNLSARLQNILTGYARRDGWSVSYKCRTSVLPCWQPFLRAVINWLLWISFFYGRAS